MERLHTGMGARLRQVRQVRESAYFAQRRHCAPKAPSVRWGYTGVHFAPSPCALLCAMPVALHSTQA